MTKGAYVVTLIDATACHDCGAENPGYRVVDSRKLYGERYPGPRLCYACAQARCERRNRALARTKGAP